jgi:hypothetical protein
VTTAELLQRVLEGFIVIVGEYRGSNVELAGYVDRKTGAAIQYVRATHLIEIAWLDRIDRVLLTQAFPGTVTTIEQAAASLSYERGRNTCFSSNGSKGNAGHFLPDCCRLSRSQLKGSRRRVARLEGGLPPLNLVYLLTTPQHQ